MTDEEPHRVPFDPDSPVSAVRGHDVLSKQQVSDLVEERVAGISPRTRRTILRLLGGIAIICIIAEAIMLYLGVTTSEALLTIAATATGALAGMARPQGIEDV